MFFRLPKSSLLTTNYLYFRPVIMHVLHDKCGQKRYILIALDLVWKWCLSLVLYYTSCYTQALYFLLYLRNLYTSNTHNYIPYPCTLPPNVPLRRLIIILSLFEHLFQRIKFGNVNRKHLITQVLFVLIKCGIVIGVVGNCYKVIYSNISIFRAPKSYDGGQAQLKKMFCHCFFKRAKLLASQKIVQDILEENRS